MFAPPLKIEVLYGGHLGVLHADTIRRALYTHPGKRHPKPQERP